jgi:hypothetical protein
MTKIAFVTVIRMQMVALGERKASFAKMMGSPGMSSPPSGGSAIEDKA